MVNDEDGGRRWRYSDEEVMEERKERKSALMGKPRLTRSCETTDASVESGFETCDYLKEERAGRSRYDERRAQDDAALGRVSCVLSPSRGEVAGRVGS